MASPFVTDGQDFIKYCFIKATSVQDSPQRCPLLQRLFKFLRWSYWYSAEKERATKPTEYALGHSTPVGSSTLYIWVDLYSLTLLTVRDHRRDVRDHHYTPPGELPVWHHGYDCNPLGMELADGRLVRRSESLIINMPEKVRWNIEQHLEQLIAVTQLMLPLKARNNLLTVKKWFGVVLQWDPQTRFSLFLVRDFVLFCRLYVPGTILGYKRCFSTAILNMGSWLCLDLAKFEFCDHSRLSCARLSSKSEAFPNFQLYSAEVCGINTTRQHSSRWTECSQRKRQISIWERDLHTSTRPRHRKRDLYTVSYGERYANLLASHRNASAQCMAYQGNYSSSIAQVPWRQQGLCLILGLDAFHETGLLNVLIKIYQVSLHKMCRLKPSRVMADNSQYLDRCNAVRLQKWIEGRQWCAWCRWLRRMEMLAVWGRNLGKTYLPNLWWEPASPL